MSECSFFFFKKKTAYERRISDWSSDVCSSDLRLTRARLGEYAAAGWFTPQEVDMLATGAGRRAALNWARTLRGDRRDLMRTFKIGRASGRERVCQYV